MPAHALRAFASLVALLALSFLLACGNGNQKACTVSGGTCCTPSSSDACVAPLFLFATTQGGQLPSYPVDRGTGSLGTPVSTPGPAISLGLADALAPYTAWLEAEHQRAMTAIAHAFASQRFRDLSQQLDELDAWALDAETDRPALEEGPRRLRRAYRRLRKKANALEADSPATEFHKVRIRAKRLRYATEFFEALYAGPARRLVRRAVELQDLLGDHQDGIVSSQRIHEALQTAADGWSAETALALGRVVQWEVERGAELRQRFPATYREVKGAWKRLRRTL